MQPGYLRSVVEAFGWKRGEGPQRGLLAYKRLNELEKYCWQMRIEE